MTAKFIELLLANIPDGSNQYPMIDDANTTFTDELHPERQIDYPIKAKTS